ncbi:MULTISPECIES: ankyrin repeat domain-containing protein [unclassified Janthinobacterium]|uniref:ankyrin repeat domain-containing protein n=1 Tax=unclassified Janthinobacterium TaxID=2610881 RepID=UPI0018CA39DB|nr:ankyrin repeat domain-containing protein [Janthinobacterium sp. CG_23.4]MDH6157947.1 ankyrin repeat protein [Janthinobacterium sp. CG_23.4]
MMKKLVLALLLCCATASQAAPEPDAFFRAVSVNNVSGVRSMLAEGMNPNQLDAQRGDIALVLALRDDADKVFKLLLDTPGIDIDARSANGNTALMMAAYMHKQDAVQALLAKGAKVNQSGWTALHYAAAAGDLPSMKIFLQRDAVLDARAPANITPLMFAAREGQEDAVKLLLSWGADASVKSDHGWTATQFAQAADKPGVAAIIAAAQKARAARN